MQKPGTGTTRTNTFNKNTASKMKTLQTLTKISLVALPLLAFGQSNDNNQLPYRTKVYTDSIQVEPDGRSTEELFMVNEIGHASVIDEFKNFSFSFSSSVQRGEVEEAYTLKKNGTRVEVPANNYQVKANNGRNGAAALFSDRTTISLVFPDLEVGDSVAIRYKIADTEPMFPGQFSVARGLSPYLIYDDAKLTIRVPKGLALHLQASGLQAVEPFDEDASRVYQWQYKNAKPKRWTEEDQGIWRVDENPSLLASTFESYEAIAKAYGDRTLPKAAVTDRIRQVAKQIIGDESRPLERARMIYEWVSRNITYGGNCIGVGAVVPRDLDFVLDNKMGDCKDHATLLQALYAATDIASEQVLVNAGSAYDLPDTPVVSMVNHVINYLPSFKMYLDSTATEIPFGYVPTGLYAKPVIHVGRAKAIDVIPPLRHESTSQRLHMRLKVLADGSADGDMQIDLQGLSAATARAYLRDLTPDEIQDFVKASLGQRGYKGDGTLDKGETQGFTDKYGYKIKFHIENYLENVNTGAMYLAPVVDSAIPVMQFASIRGRTESNRKVNCFGFHSHETYEISIPSGISLISLPQNLQVHTPLVDYVASYKNTNNLLKVKREVHDKTAVNICSADMMKQFHADALPIADNLRTQLFYKRKRN